ncbi:hypothetical protein BDB01DRAFT_846624 [Pilobolus umbonatus]|nr:hypothetical protein BDB01DRAFT_846624 [Pilobolus umbonatus]
MTGISRKVEMNNLVFRLKTRLSLANFKRKHGYENIDLRTLEFTLFPPVKHSLISYTTHKKPKQDHHRYYPSPPSLCNDTEKKNAYYSTEKRLSPSSANISYTSHLSSDEEDAAHLLVMMHQSPTI